MEQIAKQTNKKQVFQAFCTMCEYYDVLIGILYHSLVVSMLL